MRAGCFPSGIGLSAEEVRSARRGGLGSAGPGSPCVRPWHEVIVTPGSTASGGGSRGARACPRLALAPSPPRLGGADGENHKAGRALQGGPGEV